MKIIFLITNAVLFLYTSCSPPAGVVVKGVPPEQKSNTPSPEETALTVDDVARSVGKITSVAFYITYSFDKNLEITPDQITDSLLKSFGKSSVLTTKSVSGTAWVAYKDSEILGFVTAAHVVVFPDTLQAFYTSRQKFLNTVSIKIRQKNYITRIANSGEAVVVAYDTGKDIALLKKEIDPGRERPPLLELPPMTAKTITWAMPLYILGFPQGKLLLTKAVATKPQNPQAEFFSNDAVFNRGMSGAPVIACSSQEPYFRLAGIVSSASVKNINYLEPVLPDNAQEVKGVVYDGQAVINSAHLIKYGMTKAATINSFISFVKENKSRLTAEGFTSDFFIR